MLDTQQRYQIGMATGLCNHARTGIHQDNRQVSCRTTGNHVSRILLVSRSIGYDEFTVVRAEVAVSYIDRDPLLAFRFKPSSSNA